MPPRSEDFDYQGLSVSHAGGIDPVQANQRSFHKTPKREVIREPMGDVKGMVSPRERRVHNPQIDQDLIDKTTKAARQEWRNRGLSNNDIIDY